MVFDGIMRVYELITVSIPSEYERKENIRIRKGI